LAFFDAMKDEKSSVVIILELLVYIISESKLELSILASNLRGQKILSTRKPFETRNFKGINAEYAEFLKTTRFEEIAPLPKEAIYTEETAKKLPKIVEYLYV